MAGGWITTKLNYVIGWGRKFSLFHYPFITACCGMEYMSGACAHWDFDRFGCGLTTFSPRQADLIMVVGGDGTLLHTFGPGTTRFGLAAHSQMDRVGVVNWGVSIETFYL